MKGNLLILKNLPLTIFCYTVQLYSTCMFIAIYIHKHTYSYAIHNVWLCCLFFHRQLASQLSGLPREAPCYNSSTADNACPLKTEEILARLSMQYKVLPSWTLPSYRYCLQLTSSTQLPVCNCYQLQTCIIVFSCICDCS